jgi:hypothetical protein
MSKITIIVLIALAGAFLLTASSFILRRENTKDTCFLNDEIQLDRYTPAAVRTNDSPPTPQVVRGFPFAYYNAPFPANCYDYGETPPSTGLNELKLDYDLLIWFAISLAAVFGLSLVRRKKT